MFSKHTQDLKMAKKLTSEKLYVNLVKTIALEKLAATAHGRFHLGETRVQVEKVVQPVECVSVTALCVLTVSTEAQQRVLEHVKCPGQSALGAVLLETC